MWSLPLPPPLSPCPPPPPPPPPPQNRHRCCYEYCSDTASQPSGLFNRVILEVDPAVVASRVAMRGADSDVPLSEQVMPPFKASNRQGKPTGVPSLFFAAPRPLPFPCSSSCCRTSFLMTSFPPGAQTFSQALANAKEQLARSLLK